MNEPIGIENPFEPQLTPVTVTVISNGYIVSCYRRGVYEQWYCINHQEIMEKLEKFI